MTKIKFSLRNVVAIAICLASIALCFTSCGGNTQPKDEWYDFATSVLKYGSAKNEKRMVSELTISDIAIIQTALKSIAKATPGASFVPPATPPDKNKVMAGYRDEAEIFIRSYEDLFDGIIVCITPLKYQEITDVDVFSNVIIWVKKDEKTQGILIDKVIKTPNGLRVLSWVTVTNFGHGQLYSKRAILEDSECNVPDNIIYKTSYREEY